MPIACKILKNPKIMTDEIDPVHMNLIVFQDLRLNPSFVLDSKSRANCRCKNGQSTEIANKM
jgi:hypothetical protein